MVEACGGRKWEKAKEPQMVVKPTDKKLKKSRK